MALVELETVAAANWSYLATHSNYDETSREPSKQEVIDIVWTMVGNESQEAVLNFGYGNSSDCFHWQQAQHIVFQLANVVFMISFLAPSTFAYHILFLRGVSSIGCLMIVFWSTIVTCLPDYLGWNVAFLAVNMAHICYHLCTAYPTRFEPEIEDLYRRLFKPFEMPRLTFCELLEQGEIHQMASGDVYASEEESPCSESLSLLICGRIKVSCESLFLHFVEPGQFLDSVEFEAQQLYCKEQQPFYQVTIAAVEKSKIISWKCDHFRTYLSVNPFMAAMFNCILGKDIASKLYHIQEWLIKDNKQLIGPSGSVTGGVRGYNSQRTYCSNDNPVIETRMRFTGPRGEAYWFGQKQQSHLSLSDTAFETSV